MESPQRSHPSLRYTAIAKLSPIDASPSEAPSTGRTDQTMRHPQAASIIHANTSAFTELPLQVLMKFERQSALVPPARFPCDQERDRRGGAGTWRMAPPRVRHAPAPACGEPINAHQTTNRKIKPQLNRIAETRSPKLNPVPLGESQTPDRFSGRAHGNWKP